MRARSIELSGFRAFAGAASLDLDADAIVLVGPNGSGKTSLLDSLLWILCGSVPRIGDDADLVSMFSPTGGAYGTLVLGAGDSSAEISRSFDGQSTSLSFRRAGTESRGSAAFADLCEVLWPEAIATGDEAAALAAAITRSIYLQQDLVRQFISADTDQERFEAVSELVGAGRIAEFQVQLDNQRTGWTRATNERTAVVERVRADLATLEARMASLSEAPTSTAEIADRWGAWWQAVAAFGIESSVDLSPAAPQAAHVLDDAVRRVATVRRERDRRLNMMRQLLVDLIEESPIERPDLDSLRAASAAAKRTVEEAQVALASVEAAAAEARRRQVELHEARAELQALAQLALRHLGEHCPVCDQTYDSVATRARLEWIAANSGDEDAVRAPAANEVSVAAEGLRAAEEASAVADQQLRVAEALIREADLREQDLTSRLTSIGYVGLPDADAVSALEIQTATLDREISSCEELSAEGERLAVAIARIGEATQRDELQRDIASSRQRLQELEDEIAKREVTSALAVRLLAGLREASSNVVTSELERIDPLLQQIFSTIDPHPAFRAVRLLTTFAGRRGRVMAQLKDQLSGKVTDSPEMVLSSSQLNGLAVSIFLALNLGVRALPIDSVILDDPLQSLDDVNLLGLVDLLRRIREHRQLIVSTHDMRFGDLLARKLRPVAQHQRTLVYRFRGWSRFGPSLEMEEVPFDRVRLRIASSAA